MGKAAPCPCSPVGVKDSFHLRDVGLERYGTEFIQFLVVEQQVLVPETNGSEGAKDRNRDHPLPISCGGGESEAPSSMSPNTSYPSQHSRVPASLCE